MLPAPSIETLIIARSKRLIFRLIASAAILFVVLWTFLYLGFLSENARRIAQGLESQVEYLTKVGDQFTLTRLLSSLTGGGPFQTAAVFDGGGHLVVVVPDGAAAITPKETSFEFSHGRLVLWHCIVQSDSRLPEWGTLCVATRSSPWAAVWAAAILVLCLLGLSLAWLNGFKRLSREIADPVVDFAASILDSDLNSARRATAKPRDFGIEEVNQLSTVFERFWAKSVEYDAKAREMEVASAMHKIATQVAHDILSPLAALEVADGDASQLPEKRRLLIRSAVGRIRDIANSLLDKNRTPIAGAEAVVDLSLPSTQLLSSLVESLVTEKRLQYRSRSHIEIEARFEAASYGIFSQVQPIEFKRLLSNLINNAVEALGDDNGAVHVNLSARLGRVFVSVQDNGKGIPAEVLEKLGRRGETYGKAGGSGLGIYHARHSAEAWGGSLEISSEVGKGTTTTVSLPPTPAPEWFISEIALVAGRAVVILDDDVSIHQVWQARLEASHPREHNIDVVHFSTPQEIRSWVTANVNAARGALYLLDYELLEYKETGLSLAEELSIGDMSVLVTNRYEDSVVLDGCRRLKAKMIPKGLMGLVPIRIAQQLVEGAELPSATKKWDAILIDDDPLVRETWQVAADLAQKQLKVFNSAEDFFLEVESLGRDSPVYIDATLGNNSRGEDESRRIHAMGFAEVYLATGQKVEDFSAYVHLRGVVGKSAPWKIS